jgi:ArsR family transcriptional regulator
MSARGPKQQVFAQFAAVAKAVAHEHRIELLEHLGQGEQSVEVLARKAGLSVANASHHLQLMRRGGLVDARRDGTFVFYRISDEAVFALLASLRRVGEHQLAEVERVVRTYFHQRDGMESISQKELARRIRQGSVTILDVRPGDEYAAGHLRGAVNIPLDRLRRRLNTLDSSRAIVAYCRGPYCVLSFEAVALLRSKGFDVRRLEDGFPEWKAAGLPCVGGKSAVISP